MPRMPRKKRHVASAIKNGSAVKAVTALQQEKQCTKMEAACKVRDRKKRELLESRADVVSNLKKDDSILGMAKRVASKMESKQVPSLRKIELVKVCSPPARSGPRAADLSRLCSVLYAGAKSWRERPRSSSSSKNGAGRS